VQRFTTALLCLLGGVVLATVLARLAPLGWPFELFSHFRVQYAAVALALAVLLAWRRARAAAVLAAVIGAWHLLPGVAASPGAVASQACAGPEFTVATVNVQFSNERHDAFRAWLATRPADVLVIQEVTPAWAAELGSTAHYPHRHVVPREDPYGLALLSRWPLEAVTPVDLAGDGLPSLTAVVDAAGQRVRILALHTRWPITPALAAARDEALRGAAAMARATDLPLVLLGDLNVTPDSPAFTRLLRQAGLRDAMHGQGWHPTWLAGFWPLALRIDHVLVSPGLCVEQAEAGPPVGSDHRPVLARLRRP
jgi:endonuclease/exonuclease/phosphatase (EEP) superfamily protein YafD